MTPRAKNHSHAAQSNNQHNLQNSAALKARFFLKFFFRQGISVLADMQRILGDDPMLLSTTMSLVESIYLGLQVGGG